MSRAIRVKVLATSVALAGALLAIFAGNASAFEHAEPGFNYFEVKPSNTQAGGHPNVELNYQYRQDNESECPSECLFARRVLVHWPQGFIGNPHVAPTCTLTEFAQTDCPVDSQIGKVVIDFLGPEIYVPLYNMVTRPDQAGLLAFTAPLLGLPVMLELSSRTNSDYGLEADQSDTLRLPFNHYRVVLWGVPAAEENDVDRFFTPLTGVAACYIGIFGPEVVGCPPGLPFVSPTYASATIPPAPFLQNPTVCGVPLIFSADVEYYGGAKGHIEKQWPEMTGCSQASFSPSVLAKPTTEESETASGLDTVLKVPQTQSPITPSPSQLKTARVTLPAGFSINPGAADGKVACPEALSGIGTLLAATCPEASKIGSLSLDVSALPEPIPGYLYLAEPKPGDPYRVLLAASGFATNVKLLGDVRADPRTGRLSFVFENLPQSPLQEFALHVFGSERGLLATPAHCGTYQVESEFVPWNSALSTRTTVSLITIDSGPKGSPCPGTNLPFNPGVQAGSSNSTAGAQSPFSLTVSREDGDQSVTGVNVTLPPGLAATLKGVPYCPQAAIETLRSSLHSGVGEQSSPACPAASQIGTAVTGAGAGTHPLYTPGKVYLAGPYEGAPLSLLVVVPAVTGPYDLGNVVVRAAISVDSTTAQVSVHSDPLPQILEGVLLRLRTIQVNLDRSNFALNPTNCDQLAVKVGLSGDEGGSSTRSAPYQVSNCGNLSFDPKLALKLTGGTKRSNTPALTATLTAKPGEANIARTIVTMPQAILLDNAHVGNPCTRVQYAANNCPATSELGTAVATSPLLEKPLEGPVYLRSNPEHELPDLVAKLQGQFNIELVGRIDSVNERLRTSFESVPDVPVTKFTLKLAGGAKGLLQNSVNLCAKSQKASVKMVGQNGLETAVKSKLKTPCRSKAKKGRRS